MERFTSSKMATYGFEEAVACMQILSGMITLGQKCRVVLEYDPEKERISVDCFKDTAKMDGFLERALQEALGDAKREPHKHNEKNWVMINLPENCPCITLFQSREAAEKDMETNGSHPLFGFGDEGDGLESEIFITYGGALAPDQRRPAFQADQNAASQNIPAGRSRDLALDKAQPIQAR